MHQVKQYGFFPGCTYVSAAGYRESVEAVNRAVGIELIEIPDWKCCGATSIFSLNETEALIMTGRLIAIANQQGFDEILTVCNACYTTLRKAIHILSDHPEKIAPINEQLSKEQLIIERFPKIRHYLEVLHYDVPETIWSENRPPYIEYIRVASYYGCQLTRPWGDIDHPERPVILDYFIKKLGFIPIEHSAKTLCCGASFSLPYKNDCSTLITRILHEVHRKGAQWIATLCPLCQFNLDSMQSKKKLPLIPIPYFTQLAGLALGLSEKELGMNKLLIKLNILN